MNAALLVAVLAAQAPEIAVVELEGIGILLEEQQEMQQQLFGEIQRAGATAVDRLSDWVPGCLTDPGCLAEEPQSAFLAVEVTRVGPLLQVDSRMYARGGEQVLEESRSIMQGDPLLGESFAAALPGLPPPKAAVVVDVEPGEGEGEGEGEEPSPLDSLPWWGWAGAGGAVLGVVVFGTGAALAASDAGILEDPTSLGTDKAAARTRGPVALIGAVVGAAVTAAGATLFVTSLGGE